ncbi:hypothetical protein CP556_07905 [Natrinema sp. CBA1119]|uniref:hypothetical protein n=1 Tax=Natrinema sp. CBA1119 TaxID=1608465 RepID=UPI000BF2FDF0|nr:hypothetical protein [Natrinema sp. CBA1119]PGF16048.1 hypothetical protein CP556_07905 [Natrinema sp. CBA1119]
MTDDSLDERLADLESGPPSRSPSSLEDPAISNDEPKSITLFTRFWAVFILTPQVRIPLSITPGIGESPTGNAIILTSLIGGVVVAECLLRRFGPTIVSALSVGFFAALLSAIGAFVGWVVATGSSPPDVVIGTGFLVVSAVTTAHRFERAAVS